MNNECRLIIFEPQKEPRTVNLLVNEASENTQILDEHGCPVIEYSILCIEEDTENKKIQSYIQNWEKNNPISAKKAKNLGKLKLLRELRRKKKEKTKARKVKKRIIESIFDRSSDLEDANEEREILEAMKVTNVSLKKILNIKSNKSIDLNTNFNPTVNNKIVLDSTPKGVEYVVLDDSSDDDDTNIQLNIDGDNEITDINDVVDEDHSNQEQYDNRNFISPSPSESSDVVLVDSDSEIECVSIHNEVEVLSDSSDIPSKRTRLDEFQVMDESCDMETDKELPKEVKLVGIVEEFVKDSLNVSQSQSQEIKQNKKPKKITFQGAPFGGLEETLVQNFNFDSERNNLHIRLSNLPVLESDEHDVPKNQEAHEEPNSPVKIQVSSDNGSTFEQQSQPVIPELFEGRENFHQKRQQFPHQRFCRRGRFQSNRFLTQNVEETTDLVQPRQSFFQRGQFQNNRSVPQNMEANMKHVQPNRNFSGRDGFQNEQFFVQNMNENEEFVQPRRNFASRGKFQNNSFPAQNISRRGGLQNNRFFIHNVRKSYEIKEENGEHLLPTLNAGRFINFEENPRNQNPRFFNHCYEPSKDNLYKKEEYQPENDILDDRIYTNQSGFENQNYQPSRQRFQKCQPNLKLQNQKIQNIQQPQKSKFTSMLNPQYRQRPIQNQRNQSFLNQEYQVPQSKIFANKHSRFQISKQNPRNLSNQERNQNAPARFPQPNQFQPKTPLPSQNNRFQYPKNNAICQSNNLSQIPNKFQYRANIKHFQKTKFNNKKQYRPIDENYNDQYTQNDVQDYESEVVRNLQTDQNEVNDDEFVWENPEGIDFVPIGVNDPIDPPWSTGPAGGNQYKSISRRSWVNHHYS